MFKKLLVFLSIFSLILLNLSCVKKIEKDQIEPEKSLRWADAPDRDLIMFEEPDFNSLELTGIPRGDKVKLLYETGGKIEIEHRLGRWSEVEWNDKKGWVFGGFLIYEEMILPDDDILEILCREWANDKEQFTINPDGTYYYNSAKEEFNSTWHYNGTQFVLKHYYGSRLYIYFYDITKDIIKINNVEYFTKTIPIEKSADLEEIAKIKNYAKSLELDINSLDKTYFGGLWARAYSPESPDIAEEKFIVFGFEMFNGTLEFSPFHTLDFGDWEIEDYSTVGTWFYNHKTGKIEIEYSSGEGIQQHLYLYISRAWQGAFEAHFTEDSSIPIDDTGFGVPFIFWRDKDDLQGYIENR